MPKHVGVRKYRINCMQIDSIVGLLRLTLKNARYKKQNNFNLQLEQFQTHTHAIHITPKAQW
jgi:hypothetical protein